MKFLVLLIAFVVATPHAARADDAAMRSAKKHYDRGEKLFALGKFDEALDEYQKAFDAKPLPGFLFNIGQCYRNLGETDSAIFTYKKFLKLDPDAPNREKVQATIDKLEEEKARGESERLKLVEPKREPPPPPPERPTETSAPFYKQWWFWTGVAVVGVGGSIGIYEATKSSSQQGTDLGPISFPK
jgi:tetratricopeptide (TPR) repeat protein